jgi:hypothetical protein
MNYVNQQKQIEVCNETQTEIFNCSIDKVDFGSSTVNMYRLDLDWDKNSTMKVEKAERQVVEMILQPQMFQKL